MTWCLPAHEHRMFGRNPLEVVVCQLRFDPILKVQQRVAEFQDQVRSRFPQYEESEAELFELRLPESEVHSRKVRTFTLSARAEKASVTIGDQSIALQYGAHRDRRTLIEDAQLVLGVFDRCFAPVSRRRLGLRYVNLIDREQIGAALGRGVDWADLIAPGFLGVQSGLADLDGTRFATEFTSPMPRGAMTARFGILPLPSRSNLVFRLDIDRYCEDDLASVDVAALLETFADDIYRLFRAAAGKALIDWMEPT